MFISPLATSLRLGYSCYLPLWKNRASIELCVGICNINFCRVKTSQSVIGISEKFCVDDVMLNSCLLLFTNMRSKSLGRLLGPGLWSNLFNYLHINYAIAVLCFYSAWLIVFVFQKVGWNVRGVKCPRGEMSEGWNVPGWNVLGWHVFGVKCPDANKRYPLAAFNFLGCETTADFIEWDKTADFENGTKTPIFDNETKPPILKWENTAEFKVGQYLRFVIIQIASLCEDKSCSRWNRLGLITDN